MKKFTAPKTAFEKQNGNDWTTLSEEAAFIQNVETQSERVCYSVVGTSNGENPIHLIKVGYPEPPSDADIALGDNILIMGTPHGNEPSGREATLKLLRDLAFTDDEKLLKEIEDSTVLFIPTPNPDGRKANQRGNANDFDNNRDHLKLDTPEIKAVDSVINQFQPHIIVDAHERPSDEGDPDLQALWARNFNVDQSLYELNKEMVQNYVRPDVEEADFSTGLYGTPPNSGSGSERILRNMSGLRHSIGLLTEAAGQQDPKRKVDMQKQALDAVLRFYRERFDEVTHVTSQASKNKKEDGAKQKTFYLEGTREWDPDEFPTTTLDPAPKGYLITDAQAQDINKHITSFSLNTKKIGTNGVFISMDQPMMTIAPLLMDHGAEYNEIDGISLYDTNDLGTAGNMKSLAEHYQKHGEFANDRSATKITDHVAKIYDTELLGQSDKAKKQLKILKVLLDEQKEDEEISDRAAHMLDNYADFLLDKWQ